MARGDTELLDAWRAGEPAAGKELFDRHFDALYRFFRNKTADRAAADDLIQQTMLRCIEGRDTFRGDASFRTWLFALGRNELLSYWRAQRRDASQVDVSEVSVEALGTSPSGIAARRAEHRLLLRAQRALPLDLQIALELHYWEQLSGSEIADVLGIPEGTVRSRLRRAHELLVEKLAEIARAERADDELLRSTLDGLEAWAASLRTAMTERG